MSFFRSSVPLLSGSGTIVVTLFEAEPYTLWNIRDLARHVGLRPGTSYRFQAEAYPSYQHARTLGNIEGGLGWKGELRSARTFIFDIDHAKLESPVTHSKDMKRKRTERSESDSEDAGS